MYQTPGPVNPNAKAVTSESLSALWILEWTTEKEIIFLMESGLPWKPSGPVQQEIDVDAKTLSNRMLFGDDSVFEVFSSIDPEVRGVIWMPCPNLSANWCSLAWAGRCIDIVASQHQEESSVYSYWCCF